VAYIVQQQEPSARRGPLWWVVGWAALQRQRWHGVPSFEVLGVLAQLSSRSSRPSMACRLNPGASLDSYPISIQGFAFLKSSATLGFLPLLRCAFTGQIKVGPRAASHRLRHSSESAILRQHAVFVCSPAMSLSAAAVAPDAALTLPGLLPPPVLVHRSVLIVAGGGRDLAWPVERIASTLLLELPKIGRWVWSASAWISTPSGSARQAAAAAAPVRGFRLWCSRPG